MYTGNVIFRFKYYQFMDNKRVIKQRLYKFDALISTSLYKPPYQSIHMYIPSRSNGELRGGLNYKEIVVEQLRIT